MNRDTIIRPAGPTLFASRAFSLALAGACTLAFTASTSAFVVGVDFAGNYWKVDPFTAEGTLVGPTGVTGLNSLAADANGKLYSATDTQLVTINFRTGAASPGPAIFLGTDSIDIKSMAFSPDGTLYAANANAGVYDLWTIDITTGVGSHVARLDHAIQGMDFSLQGDMYGYAIDGPGLGILDPQTGSFEDLAEFEPAIDIQSFSFKMIRGPQEQCCVLFAASSNLYGMDPGTGTVFDIGEIVPGSTTAALLRGIEAFVVVPEPNSLSLATWLLCGMAGLARRRRA